VRSKYLDKQKLRIFPRGELRTHAVARHLVHKPAEEPGYGLCLFRRGSDVGQRLERGKEEPLAAVVQLDVTANHDDLFGFVHAEHRLSAIREEICCVLGIKCGVAGQYVPLSIVEHGDIASFETHRVLDPIDE
jgi:hypothetical protein